MTSDPDVGIAESPSSTEPIRSEEPIDSVSNIPASSRLFAFADLIAKLASAAGIIVIGIAGWLLQSHAETVREANDRLDRQQRKYLPMLQSLTVLELQLDRLLAYITVNYDTPFNDKFIARYRHDIRSAGRTIQFAAYSVFEPEGDPIVTLRRQPYVVERANVVRAPLRASALMLGDIMLFSKPIPSTANVKLDESQLRVEIDDVGGMFASLPLTPEALPAWRAFMHKPGCKGSDLPSVATMSEDLNASIEAILHDTVTLHSDLGDRYVSIRGDALKAQADAGVDLQHRADLPATSKTQSKPKYPDKIPKIPSIHDR